MDYLKIGSFLQALRKAKGLTQSDVADYFEISNKTVSKWECGTALPELPMLKALAEYYEVTVDEILNGCRAGIKEELNERKKKINEDFLINQKQKKLDFWMLISFISLIFGFLMIYILGYTASRADIACFVSIGIYFASVAIFFIGRYMLGNLTIEEFNQEKIALLNNRRSFLYILYGVSLLYAFAMSIVFYAIPKSITNIISAVPLIGEFILINLLGLFIAACVLGIIFYIKCNNSKILKKIVKIMNVSYAVVIFIFMFCCSYFPYANITLESSADNHRIYTQIPLFDLQAGSIIIVIVIIALLILHIILSLKKPSLNIASKLLMLIGFIVIVALRTNIDVNKIVQDISIPELSSASSYVLTNIEYTFLRTTTLFLIIFVIPAYIAFDIVNICKNRKNQDSL